MTTEATGAVLVAGGGIAGIQASLDLAESGYLVYLVERRGSIGGRMSQLDKTFPTNDCAMCMISPKLIGVASHPNIKIITMAELAGLRGSPGNFTAIVKCHPRFVDEDKCVGCNDCTEACPVTVSERFNRDLGPRKAIAKHYVQAVPNAADVLKLGHAPCKVACPAGINVQGYIQLIKKKEYIKAVNLIRERNPLSAICGRVCTHPCETACARNKADSPVAIRLLKRFASDYEMEMIESGELALPKEKQPPENAKKIAIIGAGPSGLTAADDLAGQGYAVIVHEATSAAGGMLYWGIPEYRLPKKVLEHEVELIRRKGVKFEYNSCVGKDISFDELCATHDAVFVGLGTQKGVALGVEGEDTPGVVDGLEFLRQAKTQDEIPKLKGRVAVIGGGDVAMDAACTAIRLGAEKVSIIYRRTSTELPAIDVEIKHAIQEGVEFKFLATPIGFTKGVNGGVQMTCIKMRLGEPDSSGRKRPVPIEGSEFTANADTVIIAIGSQPGPFISDALPVNKWGNIKIDKNHATELDGVFAGGDIITGPSTVIDAVAAGKRAAESIDLYLKGKDLNSPGFEDSINPVPEDLLPRETDIIISPRAVAKELPVQKRIKGFDEIEIGFTEEQALAETERCLNCALCAECMECVAACEKKAIDHLMKENLLELDIGSVILAPGIDMFAAQDALEYGYKRYANVITTMEFERYLSATGPTDGHIIRPSDKKEPHKVAWIQCVGSRESIREKRNFCSSVCCMASIKEAVVAKTHIPELESTIFYMDIRAQGKGFDSYVERAKEKSSVRYVRSMISRVVQNPVTNNLVLMFQDPKTGKIVEETFDMVVLAVGLCPSSDAADLANKLEIDVNEFGFVKTQKQSPLATSRKGVYVCGGFEGPKDIPETVAQASGAAAAATLPIASAKGREIVPRVFPPERSLFGALPKTGVFVCSCGNNIAGVVDVKAVAEYAKTLPSVVYTENFIFACSTDSKVRLKEAIHAHGLNRVVVASCSPKTHEPLFRETLAEAGLNPYLLDMANIRNQCSWVHADQKSRATEKAKDLVRMSASRAALQQPIASRPVPVVPVALVVGGGIAGMTAAFTCAEHGYETHLVEIAQKLGGRYKNSPPTVDFDEGAFVEELINKVCNHPKIIIYTNASIIKSTGHVGDFITQIKKGRAKPVSVRHGIGIIATGAQLYEPDQYLYKSHPDVITQTTLVEKIHDDPDSIKQGAIVMIQCVGSRTKENMYCSRVCCTRAVANAIRLKDLDPTRDIIILYRDIRTFGFNELLYEKARKKGVIFINYELDNEPEVAADNGKLNISFDDPAISDKIVLNPAYIVLSPALRPHEKAEKAASVFKLATDDQGFFLEAHVKLRPLDFATEGMFLCGDGHAPKFAEEAVTQAFGAAGRALSILSKEAMYVGPVSEVDPDLCAACMTCVRTCPYGVPFINEYGVSQIDPAKCSGCGMCVAECPARAITLHHCKDEQIGAKIQALLENPG